MNMLRMDFIRETIRGSLALNLVASSPDDIVYVPPYNVDLLPTPIATKIVADQEQRRDDILRATKYSVLDVGCGGGILAELILRLPFVADVTGIDLSADVLEVAETHRQKDPSLVNLHYEHKELEAMDPAIKYDVITMFEMLEHVNYPAAVLGEALDRLAPGGWLFLSTINRDFVSWFTTIFMGEHVLGIVPPGTHTLNKYINEGEIRDWVNRRDGYSVVDARGCMYLPARGWVFTECLSVGNYFMAIRRDGA